mmetsp:Transcript_19876/g.25650  ORF Transcript_19876/g.25650 Transcript_19876/m.25650 type:complete len:289 (-) Transcript_19876:317-1183(-)
MNPSSLGGSRSVSSGSSRTAPDFNLDLALLFDLPLSLSASVSDPSASFSFFFFLRCFFLESFDLSSSTSDSDVASSDSLPFADFMPFFFFPFVDLGDSLLSCSSSSTSSTFFDVFLLPKLLPSPRNIPFRLFDLLAASSSGASSPSAPDLVSVLVLFLGAFFFLSFFFLIFSFSCSSSDPALEPEDCPSSWSLASLSEGCWLSPFCGLFFLETSPASPLLRLPAEGLVFMVFFFPFLLPSWPSSLTSDSSMLGFFFELPLPFLPFFLFSFRRGCCICIIFSPLFIIAA